MLAHPIAFRILARMRNDEADVKAGEYTFPPHQTSDAILRKLVAGEAQVAVWVTIPEGFTAREIAQTLAERKFRQQRGVRRRFSARRHRYRRAAHALARGLLVSKHVSGAARRHAGSAAKLMTEQFRKELPADAVASARALGSHDSRSRDDRLADRARGKGRRRTLAHGRRILQPAALRGCRSKSTRPSSMSFPEHHDVITKRDLAIDSPYNTYLHAGSAADADREPGPSVARGGIRPAPVRLSLLCVQRRRTSCVRAHARGAQCEC